MGPQPWELRKPGESMPLQKRSDTSMGPQPWELRKRRLTQHARRRLYHFNGAAALGAAETIGTFSGVISFFRTSMGPQPWELRKLDKLRDQILDTLKLQWGRSLGSCGNASLDGILVVGPADFNGAAALGAAET